MGRGAGAIVGGEAGALGAPASSHDGFGGSSYSGDGPVGIFGDGHATTSEAKASEERRAVMPKGFSTAPLYY